MPQADRSQDERQNVEAWAASGAMALTGWASGPALGPPAALVPAVVRTGRIITSRSAQLGRCVELDFMALLGERAAIAGLRRNGPTSCGGATRLLRAADEWVAVALPRPDDLDLLPAWLEADIDADADDPWPAVADLVAEHPAADLAERAAQLGLAVSCLAEYTGPPASRLAGLPCTAECTRDGPPVRTLTDLLVVDLSSLWAGPLCGSMLAIAGATVIKAESTARPDGARAGPAPFFDLMNGGKRSVAVDFTTASGRDALARILRRADVVIESSRPRALQQLGIDALEAVRTGRPKVWLSITGFGRTGIGCDRVAFGDDGAVAGGLIGWSAGAPCFCADAVADPATGIVAAAACLEAVATGGSWLIDIALAGVAAHLAGPTLSVPASVIVAPPRARPAVHPAPALGADNYELLEHGGTYG